MSDEEELRRFRLAAALWNDPATRDQMKALIDEMYKRERGADDPDGLERMWRL